MRAVLVKNADRMMTSADPQESGIEFIFADGRNGLVPFTAIAEGLDGDGLAKVELPNPYEVILHRADGETVELPWDFVRHYCDATYRPRVEGVASEGRQSLGATVRRLRESAGLTQVALANTAGIGRVTLVRIEKGEQSPRYETLVSLAEALTQSVRELVGGQGTSPRSKGEGDQSTYISPFSSNLIGKLVIDDTFIEKWHPKYDETDHDEFAYQEILKRVGQDINATQTVSMSNFEHILRWKKTLPRNNRHFEWHRWFAYEAKLKECIEAPITQKLDVLCDLPGIRPPSASTVLHFIQPDSFPIIDRRTVETLQHAELLSFNLIDQKSYASFRNAILGIKDHHTGWSLRQIDRALFAYHKQVISKGI